METVNDNSQCREAELRVQTTFFKELHVSVYQTTDGAGCTRKRLSSLPPTTSPQLMS